MACGCGSSCASNCSCGCKSAAKEYDLNPKNLEGGCKCGDSCSCTDCKC
ncbi:hypothetical protein C5167_042687 [Papaver somniferum]|uniref:Uncharacterized protein n=1 Tax=Papaver somniferum TaxID=3469 RepID=A0A4Y7L647_PAPSO|nr:hypothetical protein C5167_042687 [Papaver somniferum]